MNRDQAVARIQQGLGFRTDRASQIVSALQEEQRDLEKGKTLPRFLLEEDAALALVQGNHEVALPTNFLRRSNILVSYIPIYSSRPRMIPWRDYAEATSAYASYSPGGPSVVSLRAETLWFEPEPDRAYSLTWTYYRKAAPLSLGTTENEWLDDDNMPELLISGAGLRIARDMRNMKAVEAFTIMQKTARASLYSDTITEEANDELRMGANN